MLIVVWQFELAKAAGQKVRFTPTKESIRRLCGELLVPYRRVGADRDQEGDVVVQVERQVARRLVREILICDRNVNVRPGKSVGPSPYQQRNHMVAERQVPSVER